MMAQTNYNIADRFRVSLVYEESCSVVNEIQGQYAFYKTEDTALPVIGFIMKKSKIKLPEGALELVKDTLYENKESLYVTLKGVFKIVAQQNNFTIEYSTESSGEIVFHVMEVLIRFYAPLYDFMFMHSSGFIKDGKISLINAFGGSGKTEVMLKALLNGAQFISDDLGIINKDGKVYPYPVLIPLRVHHYDVELRRKLNVSEYYYRFAIWCMKKNGKITRRLYNAFNLRCFVRNLPYTAFTDKTTELRYYDIDHFYWVQSSDTTALIEVCKKEFYDRMVVCLENESRKYFDLDGFLRYKFPFLNDYKEKQNELMMQILEKVSIQGATIKERYFDELAQLLFDNNKI